MPDDDDAAAADDDDAHAYAHAHARGVVLPSQGGSGLRLALLPENVLLHTRSPDASEARVIERYALAQSMTSPTYRSRAQTRAMPAGPCHLGFRETATNN